MLDQGLHLFLLLLLLPLLVQKLLQEEWLLLQQERPGLVLVLEGDLVLRKADRAHALSFSA